MKKLLLNYVYWHPVGHVIEALRFAKGFDEANPDLEVHVALNKKAPTELTKACPWIKETYAIDTTEFLEEKEEYDSLKEIPKEWDYIVTNDLILQDVKGKNELWEDEKGMVGYLNESAGAFEAKLGEGKMSGAQKPKLPEGLEYKFNSKIDLELPREATEFAKKYDHVGPKFCIMLGGSAGYSYYPGIESWIEIISALNEAFPNLKIYLTGVRESKEGRTNTQGYSNVHIQKILDTFEDAVYLYDIGLWNQLSILKQSDLFISPHTGFAFLAPCVGTPWLAISGGDWPEYFFNHVPFYSVLPDNPQYPYLGELGIDKNAKEGKIECMKPEKLEKKIPEIIEGAKLLMSEDFTYEKALERHAENIKRANIRKDKIPKGPGF